MPSRSARKTSTKPRSPTKASGRRSTSTAAAAATRTRRSAARSPPINPQVAFATALGAKNKVPSFITANGPVREARFVRNADGSPDGGVHGLFTITGRSDAARLQRGAARLRRRAGAQQRGLPHPDAAVRRRPDREASPTARSCRTRPARPTPSARSASAGGPTCCCTSNSISGQPNKNGNDGTIGRFGRKAQNKSLLIFSGEAYNVEMGITNGAFPTERDETEACRVRRLAQQRRRRSRSGPRRSTCISSIEPLHAVHALARAAQPSTDGDGRQHRVDQQRPHGLRRRRLRVVPHAEPEDLRARRRSPRCATRR